MVQLPDYTLQGPDGPIRLVEVFDGKSQLITYHHMSVPASRPSSGSWTSAVKVFLRDGDTPAGWPQAPTYSHWWGFEQYARYGEDA
jgi:Bacterial protein of unknown function (DUF899)